MPEENMLKEIDSQINFTQKDLFKHVIALINSLKSLELILGIELHPADINGFAEIQGRAASIDSRCGQLSALLYLKQKIQKG